MLGFTVGGATGRAGADAGAFELYFGLGFDVYFCLGICPSGIVPAGAFELYLGAGDFDDLGMINPVIRRFEREYQSPPQRSEFLGRQEHRK